MNSFEMHLWPPAFLGGIITEAFIKGKTYCKMLSTKYLAHHLTGSENDRRRFCNDSHHSPEKLCWRIIYNFDEINLVEYIIGLPHVKVITPLRFSQKVDAQQLFPVTKAFTLKISGAAVFFLLRERLLSVHLLRELKWSNNFGVRKTENFFHAHSLSIFSVLQHCQLHSLFTTIICTASYCSVSALLLCSMNCLTAQRTVYLHRQELSAIYRQFCR